jgi:hypothetical protein
MSKADEINQLKMEKQIKIWLFCSPADPGSSGANLTSIGPHNTPAMAPGVIPLAACPGATCP